MKSFDYEILALSMILAFLLGGVIFTMQQMDGRNDCFMSGLIGMTKEQQKIICTLNNQNK